MVYRPRRTLSRSQILAARKKARERYAKAQLNAGYGYRPMVDVNAAPAELGLSEEDIKKEAAKAIQDLPPELKEKYGIKTEAPEQPKEPEMTIGEYLKSQGLSVDDPVEQAKETSPAPDGNDPLKEGKK